jgi:hypothetical protein
MRRRTALHTCAACVTLLLLLVPEARSSEAWHRILPWGAGDGQAGKLEVPDGRYGPQALGLCGDGDLLLLDTAASRLLRLDGDGRQTGSVPVGQSATDLAVAPDCGFVVLAPDEVRRHEPDGTLAEVLRLPRSIRFVTGLGLAADGTVTVSEGASRTLELRPPELWKGEAEAAIVAVQPGLRVAGRAVGLELVDDSAARLLVLDGDPDAALTFELGAGDLASARLVDRDAGGRWVLDVERFAGLSPVVVRRTLLGLGEAGDAAWSLELPGRPYAQSVRDAVLSPDGRHLFVMLPAADGVHLLRWALPEAGAGPVLLELPLGVVVEPEPMVHEPDPSELPEPGTAAAGAAITRSEVLQRADAYVRHSFSAALCNIGSKVCGKTATSPSWVTVGSHTRVPYKWGGFSSLAQVDSGLASCSLAGDRNTTDGGASCAIGVDCSGFVSRAWNTTTKYGTSTLYQVSTAITATQLKPGDVLNDAGSHVRMLVARNPDGTLNMVESYAGSNYWRVGYTVRTWSNNTGYEPRRYVSIVEDGASRPGSADNPIAITSASFADSNTTLGGPSKLFDSYSCAPATNEAGPEVIYLLKLSQPATVTVAVTDGAGVDVDPHLLSKLDSQACLARHDVTFTVPSLAAGNYYIVADTWVNGSGQQLAGAYQLTVRVQPASALSAEQPADGGAILEGGEPLPGGP